MRYIELNSKKHPRFSIGRHVVALLITCITLLSSHLVIKGQEADRGGIQVEWSPNGQLIAASGFWGIRLYDTSLQPLLVTFPTTSAITVIARSRDSTKLASAD